MINKRIMGIRDRELRQLAIEIILAAKRILFWNITVGILVTSPTALFSKIKYLNTKKQVLLY